MEARCRKASALLAAVLPMLASRAAVEPGDGSLDGGAFSGRLRRSFFCNSSRREAARRYGGLARSLEAASQRASSMPVAEVVAHIQGVGDAEGRLGDCIGERRSGRWIEGLTIRPDHTVKRIHVPGRAWC